MKRLARILSAVSLLTLALVSCEKREPIDTMFSGFMTSHTDSQGYITSLVTDMGERYKVEYDKVRLMPDTIYRVVATLAIGADSTATIRQIVAPDSYKAPWENNVPAAMRVQDPVELISYYIGGGFLNIKVGIKVQDADSRHSVSYTRQYSNSGKLRFTIFHNAYNEAEMITKYLYMSIPLSQYGLHENDKVFLRCKGYEEDYDLELTYR